MLIVEDGTNVPNSNTYISATDFTAFCTARGYTLVSGAETLLIQAMDYTETLAYKGIKRQRDQSLQWPRLSVAIDGYYIQSDVIPKQMKDGLCQVAIAIDQGHSPTLDQPRKTILEKVGDLEVQYAAGASATVVNKKIMQTMWKILSNGSGVNNVDVGKG